MKREREREKKRRHDPILIRFGRKQCAKERRVSDPPGSRVGYSGRERRDEEASDGVRISSP